MGRSVSRMRPWFSVVNLLSCVAAGRPFGYGLAMEDEAPTERMSVALPPSVMARIDAWRRGLPVTPARSTAARALIEMALDRLEEPSEPPGRKKVRSP
jgi:hypothetical protein